MNKRDIAANRVWARAYGNQKPPVTTSIVSGGILRALLLLTALFVAGGLCMVSWAFP